MILAQDSYDQKNSFINSVYYSSIRLGLHQTEKTNFIYELNNNASE